MFPDRLGCFSVSLISKLFLGDPWHDRLLFSVPRRTFHFSPRMLTYFSVFPDMLACSLVFPFFRISDYFPMGQLSCVHPYPVSQCSPRSSPVPNIHRQVTLFLRDFWHDILFIGVPGMISCSWVFLAWFCSSVFPVTVACSSVLARHGSLFVCVCCVVHVFPLARKWDIF